MKKISLIITILMVISNIACSAENTKISEIESIQTEPKTYSFYDSLGNVNYNGKPFRILMAQYFFSPYDVSEQNGDVLNDAAYERNMNVGEKLNVKIQYTLLAGSGAESANEVIKNVQAGDLLHELAIVHPFIKLTSLIGGGYVLNWNDIGNINFDNPWWNESFNKNLVIGNILPCANSDFIYFNTNAIYFNKDIYNNYEFENLYELVYNYKWTWDKLSEIARGVYIDLNGDGVRNTDDQYGYSIMLHHRMVPLTYSCGILSGSFDENNYPTLKNINSEKMANIVQIFYSLLYENEGVYAMPNGGGELDMFRVGKIMLFNYVTQNISALRDLEFDYGMLPMPMYNENQGNYYSQNQSNVMVAPINLTDTEFFGNVVESLSYESYNIVMPALYEVTFENKYLRDEDSYKMFNIIKKSLLYDILWNYSEGSEMAYFLQRLMSAKQTDLASFYASNYLKTEQQMVAFYDMTIENYEKNK